MSAIDYTQSLQEEKDSAVPDSQMLDQLQARVDPLVLGCDSVSFEADTMDARDRKGALFGPRGFFGSTDGPGGATGTTLMWGCRPGGCYPTADGPYTSKAACQAQCGGQQPILSFQREGGPVNGVCIPSVLPVDTSQGRYATLAQCQQAGGGVVGIISYACSGQGCVVVNAPPDAKSGRYATQAECMANTSCGGNKPKPKSKMHWCLVLLAVLGLIALVALVFS